MKPYMRTIFGLLLICAIGVGATALPASAATVQPVQAVASHYHYHNHHHPHGHGGPLSPAGLWACAEHLGLPNPQSLVLAVLREGLVEFSLHELGQYLAGYYLLAGEIAYPVFDFWLNCVAPYLTVSAPAPVPPTTGNPGSPGTPSNPGAPTPPFYTLGG